VGEISGAGREEGEQGKERGRSWMKEREIYSNAEISLATFRNVNELIDKPGIPDRTSGHPP
jgi:hypothetical protein